MQKLQLVLAIAAMLLTACGQGGHDHEEGGHSHEGEPQSQNETHEHENEQDTHDHSDEEPASFQYTSYSTGLEVFAEAEPFIAGETAGVLAHFTKLGNFKPLAEGKITASLTVGSQSLRQTLESPTREGIYLFNLKPETAGNGTLSFDIAMADSTVSVTLNNVQVFSDRHDAIHAAEENAIDNPNAITFTKEQSWKIDFATELPSVQPFGKIIKTTARILPAQGEEVLITAKTNGLVTFSNTTLAEGIQVKAGTSLFSLSGAQLASNNMSVRFNEARINYETARSNYTRIENLAEDNIVSQKELLDARNRFENARLVYENLQQNFNETGEVIKSPQPGFIKNLYVTNGQYVEAGSPLLSISRNNNLFLRAEIQQKHARDLPFVTSANISSPAGNKVYTLSELNGRVVSFGKSVSEDNFLVPFTIQVENRHDFIPGSFVDIFLKAQTNAGALTVPNDALIEEQGNFSVLVQLTPELFEKREIKKGSTDGKRTEILGGLSPEERIITNGSILVKLAGASGTLDPHAGHVH